MKNDGGPAYPTMYPVPIVNGEGEVIREEFPHPEGQQEGMSIRDYFAGQAMAAMVSCYRKNMRGKDDAQTDADSDIWTFDRDMAIDAGDGSAEIAGDAYAIADAMLAARESP